MHPLLLCSATLSGQDGEILLDYSKNIVSEKTMQLLFKLVSSCHSSALGCGVGNARMTGLGLYLALLPAHNGLCIFVIIMCVRCVCSTYCIQWNPSNLDILGM